MLKAKILFITLIFCSAFVFSEKLRHNPWELIIYRSENDSSINNIRCWVKIEDQDGNDATKTKVKATYEWVSVPNVANNYRKSLYLMGGMAMHLNLKHGKYRISVSTPKNELVFFNGEAKESWESNVFLYDTENPCKVIFVYPKANENGFYSGEWVISAKAPDWHIFTKPARKS